MNWKFSRRIWLFLTASFSFGLGQAFMHLFLNFFLRSLGLEGSMQGIINAMPAIISAAMSIPAIWVTRKFSEVTTLKIGSVLSVMGLALLAGAGGAPLALAGAFIQGLGSALIMVSASPFMAGETSEANRVPLFSLQMALSTGAGFLGNILGGQIPGVYARLTGLPADSVDALRAALILAVALQLIGTIPVFFIQADKDKKDAAGLEPAGFSVENKRLMAKLIIPNFVVGLGAGATIPYLNLFIEAKFGIDYATMGSLFGWTSLATATTVLIQPWIVRKLGQIRAILAVQLASLPFLVLLGFAPWFSLVVLAMFTRGALMNAASPVYSAYAMNLLPVRDRPVYSALNMMSWNSGWALMATLSGAFRDLLGPARILTAFHWLFAWTILMYALSLTLIYFWLYPKKAPAGLKDQVEIMDLSLRD